MNIKIINKSLNSGGAAKAALRLFEALKQTNISVDHLAIFDHPKNSKSLKNKYVFNIIKKAYTLQNSIYKPTSLFSNFGQFQLPIQRKLVNSADIIHLHWVAEGVINIKEILSWNKPIIWTMHDMWPFTGGCHYSNNCNKFVTICKKCPLLKNNMYFDLCYYFFLQKEKTFSQIKENRICFVSPSRWLAKLAKSSNLISKHSIEVIANPIDTNIFKPMDKSQIRKKFKIDSSRKLILFTAMGATSDLRKGFIHIEKLITTLDPLLFQFIVLGEQSFKSYYNFSHKIINLGYQDNDSILAELYNIADLTVVPSLQENLSNVIMESLSCGVPVAAFNIGGNNDLIIHLKNGYLANPFDTEDLAKGISYILDINNYQRLSENSVNYVRNHYSYPIIVSKYRDLYNKFLS